ncbi:MAG: hypothetical protein NC116_04805 [Clostridium sp.]|nr:hypothetical protein [Clostridium sp.]
MSDEHRENSIGERKLIWDEENRLLSVDDNGFVSNYWYDADGERTVKTSGESDQVYVNGVFSGGSTNIAKFSLYVSPYLVSNQGGRYTKHIYAGSQRIVSKVGDFASYGSDPRRIEYAGSETDGLSVDYKSKYTAQQQVIKDHYRFFDVPYNGTDNNNYADGEGFCCNDGTLEAAQAKAMRKAQSCAVAKSFKDPDNYENLNAVAISFQMILKFSYQCCLSVSSLRMRCSIRPLRMGNYLVWKPLVKHIVSLLLHFLSEVLAKLLICHCQRDDFANPVNNWQTDVPHKQ